MTNGEHPSSAASRDERRDLLVEIGTEELPPKALSVLGATFAEQIRAGLERSGLAAGRLEWFATPRRLAVLVRRVATHQPEQLIQRRGPPVSIAFDAAGVATRAANAFAQSCGVTLEQLTREHDARGAEYLAYRGQRPGEATVGLLPTLVQQALEALPIPKRMRWGNSSALFVRPVHWVVLLLGSEQVPATLLGVSAGATTRGHRFMAPRPLPLRSAGQYVRTLATRGKVIASFQARRDLIRTQVESLAERLGGRAVFDEALLDEVTGLVEWPVALDGSFDPRFLALPREVLLATLQAHQRYFAIQQADGSLAARFITVSNIDSPDPQLVRAGNERVVRPRLTDAAFFWEQDRRSPLAARAPGLAAVTFQAQLGSLAARTERITALASAIAAQIGAELSLTERAALLAKCDLLSAMVGEFPELQGTMGRYYALADGEAAVVAEAIAEHYLPRIAGDVLPSSRVGDALALADKLDLIAGIFAIGQKPTGTRDPFGLRRAAIGVLRIGLEHRLPLDLSALIGQAVNLQPLATVPARASQLGAEIYDYLMERLRAQYLERSAENGITTELFDAVLANRPHSLLDIDARLRALVDFVARQEGASLAAAHKRISNILRKSERGQTSGVAVELLRVPAEQALHAELQRLQQRVVSATDSGDYAGALDQLAALRPAVDSFFDQVLVNDPDGALRANRLALLEQLRALFLRIADLSCLPG